MTTAAFTYGDAQRAATPLLLSLVGASFSGKTYSALRLASGIQEVVGGDVALIDTENGRATHYAGDFSFKHVPFAPPFSPARYLEALQLCQSNGARIIIVDSGSHSWESEGGVLEMHERELDRMAGDDWKKRDRMNFAAWIKPKQQYTRLVNTMLQMDVHMIWCFRAKKKMDLKKGEKPKELGFMSIAGAEMMYEFMLQALLYPGSNGVPTWKPELAGERQMAKLPKQFVGMVPDGAALSEEIGQALATWAAGDTTDDRAASLERIAACADLDALRALWPELKAGYSRELEARATELKGAGGCAHPDGFATTDESEARVCIHCGLTEDE